MGTKQGSTHCSVWNSHKFSAKQSKYGCVRRRLPTTYPVKAAPPFGSSNNELHSCRLSIAEKCGANNGQEQSKAPLTVRYEIHTSPRQEYSNRFAEQTMSPNNSVVFHLIMTEKWRKVVLDNLWKSHINRHSLASIWSVGSRRLLPTVCDLAINWYLWIIYTWIKKNVNKCIPIA
jgi:hypothetical protein